MITFPSRTVLAIAASTLLASSAAVASQVRASACGSGLTAALPFGQPVALSDTCSFDYGPNGQRGAASVAARGLDNGVALKASGSVAGTGFNFSTAGVTIQNLDVVMVNAPGYAGYGLVTYSIDLRGSLSANFESGGVPAGGTLAGVSYTEGFTNYAQGVDGGSAVHNFWANASADSNGTSSTHYAGNTAVGSIFGIHTFTVKLLLNNWVQYNYELQGSTYYNGVARENSGSASFDLGNSVYWGGISSVTTLDGTPIAFSAVNDAGLDYSKSFAPAPVPEPDSALLLLAGLSLITLRRSRARG